MFVVFSSCKVVQYIIASALEDENKLVRGHRILFFIFIIIINYVLVSLNIILAQFREKPIEVSWFQGLLWQNTFIFLKAVFIKELLNFIFSCIVAKQKIRLCLAIRFKIVLGIFLNINFLLLLTKSSPRAIN